MRVSRAPTVYAAGNLRQTCKLRIPAVISINLLKIIHIVNTTRVHIKSHWKVSYHIHVMFSLRHHLSPSGKGIFVFLLSPGFLFLSKQFLFKGGLRICKINSSNSKLYDTRGSRLISRFKEIMNHVPVESI